MNFRIIINGQPADIGELKQEIILQNPMFDYNSFTGAYGLPFSLPFSNNNNKIFKNANSEFSEAINLSYTCEQYYNDDLIAEGLIVLKDTNNAYNCHFTSNLRTIFTPISGTVLHDGFLKEILPAGPNVSTIPLRNAMATWNNIVAYPTINNPAFYTANAPGSWANYVNDHNGSSYIGTTFVPVVSIKYILAQLSAYYGITFIGDAITDAYCLNRLCVFTNTAEDGSPTANLKAAVGEVTVSNFIHIIRSAFGLTGDIDLIAKTIKLDFCKKYYDAEIPQTSNWSDYCTKIQTRNPSPYNGIELNNETDLEDKYYKDSSLNQAYKTPVGLQVSPNRIIKPNMTLIAGTNGAIMNQPGNTNINNQINIKTGLRFGYYLDIASTAPGFRPHISSASVYNISNLSRLNTGPYAFESEETFWKSTFEATFQINLRRLSLSSIDIKQKIHVNGWNYIIKRIVINCQNPEKSLLEVYRA
jgi:hypothetical protein